MDSCLRRNDVLRKADNILQALRSVLKRPPPGVASPPRHEIVLYAETNTLLVFPAKAGTHATISVRDAANVTSPEYVLGCPSSWAKRNCYSRHVSDNRSRKYCGFLRQGTKGPRRVAPCPRRPVSKTRNSRERKNMTKKPDGTCVPPGRNAVHVHGRRRVHHPSQS